MAPSRRETTTRSEKLDLRLTPEAKRDLVLRLLRGDAPEVVSEDSGVPTAELEVWKRAFLEGAVRALDTRPS